MSIRFLAFITKKKFNMFQKWWHTFLFLIRQLQPQIKLILMRCSIRSARASINYSNDCQFETTGVCNVPCFRYFSLSYILGNLNSDIDIHVNVLWLSRYFWQNSKGINSWNLLQKKYLKPNSDPDTYKRLCMRHRFYPKMRQSNRGFTKNVKTAKHVKINNFRSFN